MTPDEEYLKTISLLHLNKVLSFDPYASYPGVRSRSDFSRLMGRDPAFDFLGLDDERYVIARVGGNLITSLHRKLGDMYYV